MSKIKALQIITHYTRLCLFYKTNQYIPSIFFPIGFIYGNNEHLLEVNQTSDFLLRLQCTLLMSCDVKTSPKHAVSLH